MKLPMACLALNEQGVVTSSNPAAEVLLKRSSVHIVGQPFKEFLAAPSRKDFSKHLHDVYRQEQNFAVDLKIIQGDKNEFYGRLFSCTNKQEKPILCYGVLIDVTPEINRTQNLLKEHERLSFHVENSPLALIEYDHEFKIRRWSPRAEKLFGWQSHEVLGRHNLDLNLVHPEDRSKVSSAIKDLIEQRKPRNVLRNRNFRKDGTIILCEWYNSILRDENGNLTSILSLAQDITHREQSFMERSIAMVSERERQRIGSELHDVLAQQLAGLAFLSKTLQVKLSNQLPALASDAAQLADLASEAAVQVRNISSGLYPAELERRGLLAALKELALGQTQIYGIPCTLDTTDRKVSLDPTTALNLFRIAQEAVTNAMKHAQATSVTIRFRSASNSVILTVTDDGCGFDGAITDTTGKGVRIMKYRAESIGATLQIDRRIPQGTLITCTLPLKVVFTQ